MGFLEGVTGATTAASPFSKKYTVLAFILLNTQARGKSVGPSSVTCHNTTAKHQHILNNNQLTLKKTSHETHKDSNFYICAY